MTFKISRIDRQDEFKRWIMPVRKQVFIYDLHYSREDNLVFCKWDILSNHYYLYDENVCIGVISIADLSGLESTLDVLNIDPSLRVGKPHKLAILKEYRGSINLRKLLNPLQDEIKANFDYLTIHVTAQANNPLFNNHLLMKRRYEKLGFKEIATDYKPSGSKMIILGANVVNF